MILVIFMCICKIMPIHKYRHFTQKDFLNITCILVFLSIIKVLTIVFCYTFIFNIHVFIVVNLK